MLLTTAKFIEMPLRHSLPFTSHSTSSNIFFSSSSSSSFDSAPKPLFRLIIRPYTNSSLRTNKNPKKWAPRPPPPSPRDKRSSAATAPWLHKWPPINEQEASVRVDKVNSRDKFVKKEEKESRVYVSKDKGQGAIDRIVLRLRNLGLGSDDEDEESEIDGRDLAPLTGEERLGDLLKREWVRPDKMLIESDDEGGDSDVVLPWEREEKEERGEGGEMRKKRTVKAPSLAELTLEDAELRRLRRVGMYVRERVSVPKAGITKEVLEKIHLKWRKEELVRLKFHEDLARDMKTAHEIVEVS